MAKVKNIDNGEIVERKLQTDYDGKLFVNYKGKLKHVTRIYDHELNDYVMLLNPNDKTEYQKRYQKIFSGDSYFNITHRWVHQTQLEARDANERLFFGPDEPHILYSYGHHFPLGIRLDLPRYDTPVILVNTNRYSRNTNEQRHTLLKAIPDDWTVVKWDMEETVSFTRYVTNAEGKHDFNVIITWFINQMNKQREKGMRRVKVDTLEISLNKYNTLKKEAQKFIEVFQCKSVLLQSQLNEINRDFFSNFAEARAKIEPLIEKQIETRMERDHIRANAVNRYLDQFINVWKDYVLVNEQIEQIKDPNHPRTKMDKLNLTVYTDLPREQLSRIVKRKSGKDLPSLEFVQNELGFLQETDILTLQMAKILHQNDGQMTLNALWKVCIEAGLFCGYGFLDGIHKRVKRLKEMGFVIDPPTTNDTLIAFNGEYFRTSLNVTLTIKEVREALAIYKRYASDAIAKAIEKGNYKDFVNINGRLNLANYSSVPAVDPKGRFKFGCHIIPKTEIEYVIQKLNEV